MTAQTEHSIVAEIIAVCLDLGKLTRRKHLKAEEVELKQRMIRNVKRLAGSLAEEGGEC